MGMYDRIAVVLLGLCLVSPGIFPQEGEPGTAPARTIPDVLRRPDRGEAPRYPQDLVIGELGQGQAPEEAYRFARDLLAALTAGNKTAPVLEDSSVVLTEGFLEEILEEIESLQPRTYRIGGGRIEADGNVSFLIRFLGKAESISGELFVRQEEKWLLDDIILEERRALAEIRDSYHYDFSPYERFF